MFDIAVQTLIKASVCSVVDDSVVQETPWIKNLILDQGLNALVSNGTYPANIAMYCHVGTSAGNPVKVVVTNSSFTQDGFTLTSSDPTFQFTTSNPNMAGSIFKWGTGPGGVENYIIGVTNGTTATVLNSATITTPSPGTVWGVNQTSLDAQTQVSNAYITGHCGSVYTSTGVTHTRAFSFPVATSSYIVQEIGWSKNGVSNNLGGRIILPDDTLVVPANSSYLRVTISQTFTYSPNTPTAVASLGGKYDTAGTLMIESLSTGTASITSNGVVLSSGPIVLDNCYTPAPGVNIAYATATYTQNNFMGGTVSPTLSYGNSALWSSISVPYSAGYMRLSNSFSISSNTTIYGIGLGLSGRGGGMLVDLKLTTPIVCTYTGTPTSFNTTWQMRYSRILSN